MRTRACMSACTAGSSKRRPMRRLASNTVFFGFSATWFFAASPMRLRGVRVSCRHAGACRERERPRDERAPIRVREGHVAGRGAIALLVRDDLSGGDAASRVLSAAGAQRRAHASVARRAPQRGRSARRPRSCGAEAQPCQGGQIQAMRAAIARRAVACAARRASTLAHACRSSLRARERGVSARTVRAGCAEARATHRGRCRWRCPPSTP